MAGIPVKRRWEGPVTFIGDVTVEGNGGQALLNLAGTGTFNYSGAIYWNAAYNRYWSFLHRSGSGEEGDFSFEYFNGSTYNVFFKMNNAGVLRIGPNLSRVITAENIGAGLTWDATNNVLKNTNIAPTDQNVAYTFTAADAGKAVGKSTTTARTYTVNNNVFAAGDVVTVYNNAASGNITIAGGTGVTVRLAGTTTTGSRTVAAYGVATLYFLSPSVVLVSGAGVT